MKNTINTINIGKKTHNLVNLKENTLCCHKKKAAMWFHSKGCNRIFLQILVFFPNGMATVMQILGGRLDSCFLRHTKKYMPPINALAFQKFVKMCDKLKSPCKFITLWGVHEAKKG